MNDMSDAARAMRPAAPKRQGIHLSVLVDIKCYLTLDFLSNPNITSADIVAAANEKLMQAGSVENLIDKFTIVDILDNDGVSLRGSDFDAGR